jgi:hypothetical protein
LGFLLLEPDQVPSVHAWKLARTSGVFIVYNLIFSLISPTTDLMGHVGGLITGFAAGAAMARPLSLSVQKIYPLLTAVVALTGIVIAWASLTLMAGKPTTADSLYKRLLNGNSISVAGNNRVYYSGKSTENDARKLTDSLVKAGVFRGKNSAVLLSQDSNGAATVSFFSTEKDPPKPAAGSIASPRLVPFPWDDPVLLAQMQTVGTMIAPSVGGPPITVAILSSDGVEEKRLKVDMRIAHIGLFDAVWYSAGATLHEAEDLGKALQDAGLFRNHGARVYLAKGSDGPDVSIVVMQGAADDPGVLRAFRITALKLSKSLGVPVHLHLVDATMQHKKDL